MIDTQTWVMLGLWIVLSLLVLRSFRRWKKQRIQNLSKRSQLIQTAYGPIEYVICGKGPSVLVVHGTPGGFDQGFYLLKDLLVQSGYQCIFPSRPGFLRTPIEVGKTPEQQADALSSMMDQLGVSKVALIGLSGGGSTTLQFALRHPEKVWGLVLCSSVTRKKRRRPNWKQALLMTDVAQWVMGFLPQFAMKKILRRLEPSFQSGKPEPLDQIFENILPTPASSRLPGLLNDLEQVANLSLYPLSSIKAPTLVIHGRLDPLVPFEDAQRAAEEIPLAELFEVKNGGHHLMSPKQAQALEERLIDFLHSYSPSKGDR